jgi:HEAT repeat protein
LKASLTSIFVRGIHAVVALLGHAAEEEVGPMMWIVIEARLEELARQLSDPDAVRREDAILALDRYDFGKGALPAAARVRSALGRVMRDEHELPALRIGAALRLVTRARSEAGRRFLLDLARDPSKDEALRWRAVASLAALVASVPEATAVLRVARSDPQPLVRLHAACAWAELEPGWDPTPVVADLLDAPDDRVRVEAVKALMVLDNPAAREALDRARGDHSKMVRSFAELALRA